MATSGQDRWLSKTELGLQAWSYSVKNKKAAVLFKGQPLSRLFGKKLFSNNAEKKLSISWVGPVL